MISFFRVIRFAFQNFFRNFWLSVITISMLALTLTTVNILLVLNLATDAATKSFEQKVDVSVYFNADTQEDTVKSAAAYLRGLAQVRDVVIVTPDEALARFKERHADNAALMASLEEIGENPFGYSLVVKAYNAADFDYIIQALDAPQFSSHIRNHDFSNYSQYIDTLTAATDKVRFFGLALSIVFLIIAILIIFNTVRITIFVHREEIGIMKLVGATNSFVRAPYFVEAIIYSALAVALSTGILFPAIAFLEPKLEASFDSVPVDLVQYFVQNGPLIFGLQFAAVALVCIVSTWFAMRRFLKV